MANPIGWWYASEEIVCEGARRFLEDLKSMNTPEARKAAAMIEKDVERGHVPTLRHTLADCFEVPFAPRGAAR